MRYFRALMAIATGALTALPLAAQDSPPLDPDIPTTVVRTGPSLDDRVTIPINIDGKGPWNFVIDTGSQRTVIARGPTSPSRSAAAIASTPRRRNPRSAAIGSETSAPFFARRFANERWAILSPRCSVTWDGVSLDVGPGAAREQAPAPDAGAAPKAAS